MQSLLKLLLHNKRYYITFLVLSLCAWAWTGPLGRHHGHRHSRETRPFTSIQAIFVLWLLSAVFYHLPPTFHHLLGFDARSQLSLLIVVFISTLPILSIQHSCTSWTSWALGVPFKKESTIQTLALLTVNSFAVSLFTSSYFALCGNEQRLFVSRLVCLRPIPADSYPNFSSLCFMQKRQPLLPLLPANPTTALPLSPSFLQCSRHGSPSSSSTLSKPFAMWPLRPHLYPTAWSRMQVVRRMRRSNHRPHRGESRAAGKKLLCQPAEIQRSSKLSRNQIFLQEQASH